MKSWLKVILFLVGVGVLTLAWVIYYHNAAVAAVFPKSDRLQSFITRFGQKVEEPPPEDEDPDTTKNSIPVHTAHISVATLHRYIEGFGVIAPRPPRSGQMAGGANLSSPIPGVVAKVLCQVGQQVHAGDAVIQLDDRLAKSAQEQAAAGLEQAQASLAALVAQPRPDQLQIAELSVQKSQAAVGFAEKNYERLKALGAEQGVSGKTVEQASMDLGAARTDLAIAQKQLAILKATPTPEDLAAEKAKVAQATAALATAKVQQQMMTLSAPIDATVMAVTVNPGEAVDVTRPLVQLIATDRLMVDVDVPADQLPAAADGLAVQILPASANDKTGGDPVVGKISSVSPQVDAKSGTVMVGIDLPAGATMRPGLTVRVKIIADEHKDVLAVPRDAVVADENGDSVIALVEGDQATRKTVKAGVEENGLIEISADGLKEGDTVVTSGAYGLPQATKVKVLD